MELAELGSDSAKMPTTEAALKFVSKNGTLIQKITAAMRRERSITLEGLARVCCLTTKDMANFLAEYNRYGLLYSPEAA